jgi:translation initiation factor 1
MSKPKNREGVVFSTNPEFQFNDLFQEEEKMKPWPEQKLKVLLDKSGRAGKVVTLIEGFVGSKADLENLGKELKSYCGTGGSAKDYQVLIQGDVRKKAAEFLQKKGAVVKLIS